MGALGLPQVPWPSWATWPGVQAFWGALGRRYLALHVPQHQVLVPDVQDEVLSPDASLGVQQLEPRQAVLGAAQVPLQPHRQQVLGGTRRRLSPRHPLPPRARQTGTALVSLGWTWGGLGGSYLDVVLETALGIEQVLGVVLALV